MPGRPILVDVTRLLTRRLFRAPTGIDRVDLAYASRFLARPDAHAVAITRWGTRVMPKGRAVALVATLSRRWLAGNGSETGRVASRRLAGWLSGGPDTGRARWAGADSLAQTLDRSVLSAEAVAWRGAEDVAPHGSVYLHTSHLRLDRPRSLRWLDRRPDIRPVFFVHDLIPIDFPEYGVPGEARRHEARMDTVARRGAAVLTNSRDVANRFAAFTAERGLPAVPAVPAPLGVEDIFLSGPAPFPAARPYFVACSTIEPRKNHLLLLQLWRELAAELGSATPALIIVGRRGWENEGIVDLLDRSPLLAPHVIDVSELGTSDVASLMAGARALLMPSFAEGYGIPIAEALSVGTPAIVSDLPAHREVAEGGRAVLLDPLDGLGWRRAVLDALAAPAPDRRVGRYRSPTWAGHFAIVDELLRDLAGAAGSGEAEPALAVVEP